MSVRVLLGAAAAADELEVGSELELDAEESRYVARVRRRRAGEVLDVLSHEGGWRATLLDPGEGRRGARVRLDAALPRPTRKAPRRLLLGIVERAALAEAIKAATALDVAHIDLVRCERSQREAPKAARIEASIDAVRRQCGRVDRPSWREHPDLATALAEGEGTPLVVAAPGGAGGIGGVRSGALRLAVGPEGGFSEAELAALERAGALPLGLGPWILRTELAVAAALATLQTDL